MQSIIIVNFLFFCIIHLVLTTMITEEELIHHWTRFKMNHNKKYRNKVEESNRLQTFQTNLQMIEEHNKQFENGDSKYRMSVNKFSDLTSEEFNAIYNKMQQIGPRTVLNYDYSKKPKCTSLPAHVDWRKKGAVTQIKDQGFCGSCWSFSATGAMEGAYYLNSGYLVSLSEQNLIDCSGSYGNFGCNGGWMDNAFEYVIDHGISSEALYPYEGYDGRCRDHTKNISKVFSTLKSFTDISPWDEEELKEAVANVGPISIAVDASLWQFYSDGIFADDDCSPFVLNHGVLCVGYGSDNGTEYWLVKNSWGTFWGDDGYMKIRRNYDNHCGVATAASYPVL